MCFLLIGNSFVLQRTLIGSTKYLTIRGDTIAYIAMIEGNWSSVNAPYKFRVLVPFVASLLPCSPTDSLRGITYLSLFLAYIYILLTCSKLGLNINQSAIGLAAVWASTWHLYNYHNPFLTDAFGILVICMMIFALISDSFSTFVTASFLGVLAREATIFLIPTWVVKKQVRRSILLFIGALVLLFIPRYFLGSETDPTLISAFNKVGFLHQPSFVIRIFASWGFVWFLSLIGIWYLPREKFVLVAVAFLSLLFGAFFTSLIATDTGRMFSILTPVLAISSAQLYSVLFEKKRIWAFILCSLIVLQLFVTIPNIFFPEGSRIFGWPRFILLICEVIFTGLILLILRKSLTLEVREKASYVFKIMRKPFVPSQ